MTTLAVVDSEPMRLDDAVTWYLGSWPYEGPRVPTKDTVRGYAIQLKWFIGFAASIDRLFVADLDADLLRMAIKAVLEERLGEIAFHRVRRLGVLEAQVRPTGGNQT